MAKAKKKDKKKKKVVEPEFMDFPKVHPPIRVNAGVYARNLIKKKPIDDAILFAEGLAKPLIGNDQSVINPEYPFWNTVRNTLLNIKDPSRKERVREKLNK